jgi:GNAT superfamily N-acetyltransferase
MIHVRPMTMDDLALGRRLTQQAGWNQTAEDWQRLLALQPDGCFVGEWGGQPVATTMTCIFGPTAWVAAVLVEEAFRRRGLARALMHYALAFLDRRGVVTVRLDATPLGRPLYEQLGFRAQFEIARYAGTLPSTMSGDDVASASSEEWEELAALDERITHTDRRKLLFRLFAERPDAVRVVRDDTGAQGWLTARPGAQAVQIGPCVALAEVGQRLFAGAWRRYAGQRVYLDVPLPNVLAGNLAEAMGLTVQRRLTRMSRGEPIREEAHLLWASSGPEKG